MNTHRHDTRRTFLRGVGAIGVAGLAGAGTAAAGKPSGDPSVNFPDQQALILPENPAPMEAAVETTDVHMPDGGWVVITEGETPVGRSIKKLPAGHFKNLKVATEALPSRTHTLTAWLARELSEDSFTPYTVGGVPVSATAQVTYP